MNRVTSTALLLLPALLGLSGCAAGTYRTADISQDPELVHIQFKSLQDAYTLFDGIKMVIDPETKTLGWDATGVRWAGIKSIEFEDGKTFSAGYYRSFLHRAPNSTIQVEFPGGHKYAAIVDTDFPVHIVLTSDIVVANELPIYPFEDRPLQGACRIGELKVGSARVRDVAGAYREEQWQFRILGRPVYKHPVVFLGLPFMASFDYVAFDNVAQEVTFSKDGAFEPDDAEQWTSYPFEIKPDLNGNDKLMVQMPVAGQVCELSFASCGDNPGLHLSRDMWDDLSQPMRVEKQRQTTHYWYQTGVLPCEIATVAELSLGPKTIANAEVLIPDDPERLSLVSLGYFQDTVVVLDFVNKLMWIRS